MLVVRDSTPTTNTSRQIPLNGGFVCIVDDFSYDFLKSFHWRYVLSNTKGYAAFGKRINGKYHLIRMHRLITQAPSHMKVHHINHNRLDNRFENLRLVTEREHRHFDGWHIFFH